MPVSATLISAEAFVSINSYTVMNLIIVYFAAIIALFAPFGTFAANEGPKIEVRLTAYKVGMQADGKETLTVAAPMPGDVVEYRAVYENRGKTDARQVQAVLPIPADAVEYIPGTAQPARALASTDGKQFAQMPLQRPVPRADGSTEMREVPASEYRYLRWELGNLPAGKSATVSSRVRIPSTPVTH